jgi:hypothetical protein
MPRSLIAEIIPPAVNIETWSVRMAERMSCGVPGDGTSKSGREESSGERNSVMGFEGKTLYIARPERRGAMELR